MQLELSALQLSAEAMKYAGYSGFATAAGRP